MSSSSDARSPTGILRHSSDDLIFAMVRSSIAQSIIGIPRYVHIGLFSGISISIYFGRCAYFLRCELQWMVLESTRPTYFVVRDDRSDHSRLIFRAGASVFGIAAAILWARSITGSATVATFMMGRDGICSLIVNTRPEEKAKSRQEVPHSQRNRISPLY